ncbi:MAG: DUF6491 family protein [Erythrobacter sp.]
MRSLVRSNRSAIVAGLGLILSASACAPVESDDGAVLAASSTQSERAGAEELSAREQGGRECFYPRNVNGFRNVEGDEEKVLVDVGAADTFELQLMNRCPELRFARGITFDTVGTSRVCNGLQVDLIVPDPNLGPQRCTVTTIRRLSSDEPGARAGAAR